MRNSRLPPYQEALAWLFVVTIVVAGLAILVIAGGI